MSSAEVSAFYAAALGLNAVLFLALVVELRFRGDEAKRFQVWFEWLLGQAVIVGLFAAIVGLQFGNETQLFRWIVGGSAFAGIIGVSGLLTTRAVAELDDETGGAGLSFRTVGLMTVLPMVVIILLFVIA